jgi:hypothetical protein
MIIGLADAAENSNTSPANNDVFVITGKNE